jgi:hypothetical protein
MSDYRELLRLRNENEQAQQDILARALAGFEANYERNKFGRFLSFFDRGFNASIRQGADRHIDAATERTRIALRNSARDLTRFPGLTEDQRIELGRYGIGTTWEGNVYLEEKVRS